MSVLYFTIACLNLLPKGCHIVVINFVLVNCVHKYDLQNFAHICKFYTETHSSDDSSHSLHPSSPSKNKCAATAYVHKILSRHIQNQQQYGPNWHSFTVSQLAANMHASMYAERRLPGWVWQGCRQKNVILTLIYFFAISHLECDLWENEYK